MVTEAIVKKGENHDRGLCAKLINDIFEGLRSYVSQVSVKRELRNLGDVKGG